MKTKRKMKFKKYIVSYYGWISSYGDWDCDDFIVLAENIAEAKKVMTQRLQNILLKGKPSIMLLSTFTAKMKAFEPKYKKQMEEINNQAKQYETESSEGKPDPDYPTDLIVKSMLNNKPK